MKSFTHYPVAALWSFSAGVHLRRDNHQAGRPALFWLTLMAGLLLLAGSAQAQPFNETTVSPALPVVNPLGTMPNGQLFTVGSRSVPVFVDIDNDCDKDCFVGNGSGNIIYYKNMGTASAPTFVRQLGAANPMNGFAVPGNAKPTFVDIESDGDLDCFVGAFDGSIHAFKNIGTLATPSFEELFGPNPFSFEGNPFSGVDVGFNASPAFLDFDGDGDQDCLVGNSASTASIRFFRNEGDYQNAGFVELPAPIFPTTSGDINSNACLTTLNRNNGDSHIDLYVGMSSGKFLHLYNNSGSNFSAVVLSPLDNPSVKDVGTTNLDYSSPTFVDIDGDGDLDCFSGRNNGTFVYYRNDATSTARTITCKPNYFVTLDASGQRSIVTGTVGATGTSNVSLSDVLLSTTFNCLNELTFTITSSRVPANFSCADATNTTADPTGVGTTTPGTPTPTLTLQASNAAGTTATCFLPVKVLDKTPPTLVTPSLAPVSVDICATSTFLSTYTTPKATDACPVTATMITGVPTPTALANIGLGPQTVTWTYTDMRGNITTQTQIFNIVSNVPPSFTSSCFTQPIDLISNSQNPCGYTASQAAPPAAAFTPPTATDCEAITYSSNFTPSSFFPVGPNTVTYAATDARGNTSYCNFTVMVRDQVAPVATNVSNCPPPTVSRSANEQGVCGATYAWTTPTYTVTDNCDGSLTAFPTVVSGPAAPGVIASSFLFPVGVTTVSYVAKDVSGNLTSFCTFTVTVNDAQAPSITCPVSTNISTAPGSCDAFASIVLPTATDNCAATVTETPVPATFVYPRTQLLVRGPNIFSFVATDAANNTAPCSYTITVKDTEKPKFTNCPVDINVSVVSGDCSEPVSWGAPTVTDNCPNPSVTIVVSGKTTGTITSPSFTFNEGISTVTYTATDGTNTSTCSFKVQVTNPDAPTISCPASVVVSPGNACTYTLVASDLSGVTYTTPVSCDRGVLTYYNSSGTQLVVGTSTFGLINTTLTARATDDSGRTGTCTFNLQVVDQTAPAKVSCPPQTVAINSEAGVCGANPTWAAPVYKDNCSLIIDITRSITAGANTPNTAVVTNNNGGFFPVGTTTVNYIAKDSPTSPYINVDCSVVVTVQDKTLPKFSNCPLELVVLSTTSGCVASHTLLTPVVTDNCPPASVTIPAYPVTFTLSGATTTANPVPYNAANSAVTLNLGSTTVVYSTVDDAVSSNASTCTYIIRVVDQTAPSIICPVNQNIVANGCSAASAPWMDPVSSDNCAGISSFVGPTVVSSPNPVTITGTNTGRGGTFPSGSTMIRYTATDNAFNVASCTFTIFVQENVPPTITCPPTLTVSTASNSCTRLFEPSILTSSATGSDLCSSVTFTNSLQTNPVIVGVGGGSIRWTATDASGNTAICSQLIIVADLVPPVITCPTQPYTFVITNGNTCVENGNNSTSFPTFTPPTPTATDNCPGSLTAIIRTPGQPGQYCVNTVNYIQWQVSDNTSTSTCSQQIIIQTPGATATTAQISGCTAATVTLQDAPGCPASLSVTPATFGLTATDNLGNPISITPSVAVLNATGSTQTITFSATVGQSVATCVKSVIVNPAVEICGNNIDDDCNPSTSDVCPVNPAPTFTNCPTSPSVLTVNAANCSATATFTVPSTNPVGLAVTITGASSPFSGTSTITYTASNANGTATCVRTVTVTPVAEVCVNGIDDDCDGLVDAADPECGGGNPTACTVVRRQANDGLANDFYGNSVDIDGDLAVVGAYYDDNPGMNSGSVYVLARSAGNTWVQAAKLLPTDGTSGAGDWFGRSVAIHGDYIVVGAPQEAGSGAIYVFHKPGVSASNWVQVARFVDATGVSGDQLGYSVAIGDDYIIAGAPNDEPTAAPVAQNNGSVSIYQRTSGPTWTFIVKRTASDAMPGDVYGSSVSIDGDYAAVGAPLDDYIGNRSNAGSVYVLRNDANAWTQIQHPHASDYLKDDNYGTSVAISGTNLLVGAPLNDVSAKQNAGSVYALFQDEGGADAWGEVENLIANDFTAADQFGISVSLDGDVAAIGAHFDDIHGFHSGSAYLFDGSSTWTQVGKVDDVTGDMNDNFGYSVGISGSTVIVGSWKDDYLGAADQGSVSIFDNCSTLFQSEAENREEAATPLPTKVGKVVCAPNPATDIINIDVTLTQEEAVRITACDATGRLVETIFDGKAPAESRFQWDAGRYGRGMYFIRVQSASVTKVVSVTLLR